MASGRTTIHRRKSAARSGGGVVTARNTKPRIGSPEGVEVRHDVRAAHTPNGTNDRKLTYIKPGSRNPRKVGR
jgi:hypothetical protein